jgi:hypothetical protein
MRIAIVLLLALATVAHADPLKSFAGQIVLSHDAPSPSFSELPAYLKANADKSGHYEMLHWDVNFVGVLAKPADKVTLVVTDPATKTALVEIELAASRQVVIGHFKPTKAAGFAAGTVYAVTLVTLGSGKTVVAKAELVLRE